MTAVSPVDRAIAAAREATFNIGVLCFFSGLAVGAFVAVALMLAIQDGVL